MFTDGFFRRWLWIYCHIYKIQYGGFKMVDETLEKIVKYFEYYRK